MGFRMNGFLLASYDAARALDAGDKKLLSMNAEIDPAEEQVRAGDNCFTREELQDIFAFARHSIVQAAEQIYGGKIEVCPLEQDGRRLTKSLRLSIQCFLIHQTSLLPRHRR